MIQEIKKLQKNNKIRIIHHVKLLKRCKVRKKIIQNVDDWNNSLLRYAYLPRYKRKGSWDKPGSKLVLLCDYQPNQRESKHIQQINDKTRRTPVITTAYSREAANTIIVDGVHRSIGVQRGIINFPVIWLEYYGDLVHHVFCVEFMNLILSSNDSE